MTTEDAQQLAAYVESPRHVVRYRSAVVRKVYDNSIELVDGTTLSFADCDAARFSVCEIRSVDWRRKTGSEGPS